MSRQFRYRMTAIALGGLLLGIPLLTNGTASAGQIDGGVEGARQVTFEGGGVLGLSCHSRPDVESMTVPPGSTVQVVNNTGHTAKLQLGGVEKGTLPDASATQVVFRHGSTPVLLTPDCALGSDASPSMISVTPSPSAAIPAPLPASASDSPSPSLATSASGSAPPMAIAGGASLPDAMAPAQLPSRLAPRSDQAATHRVAQVPVIDHTKTKVNPAASRTAGEAGRAFAGMPPGERKTLLDGVPKQSGSGVSSGVSAAAPEAVSAPASEGAAAETVAAIEPLRGQQPIGLLAVIAVVFAVGVAVAAIRAFVSQRANRVVFA